MDQVGQEMIKAYNKIYSDDEIKDYTYIPGYDYMIIQSISYHIYKVVYNNGNIEISCLN